MPCKITGCPNPHDSPSLFTYYAPSADVRQLSYIAALFVLIYADQGFALDGHVQIVRSRLAYAPAV